MAVDTFYYNAVTESGTNWDNDAYCVDNTNATYATRAVPLNTAFETTKWIKGTANNASGIEFSITKVEIGVEGKASGAGNCQLRLVPMFGGSSDGDNHDTAELGTADTTTWFDITSDTNAPGTWGASDVDNLDVRMFGDNDNLNIQRTIYIDQIYVRVTHVTNDPIIEQLHYYKITTVNTLTSDDFNDNSIGGHWTVAGQGTYTIDEEDQIMKITSTYGEGVLYQAVTGDFDAQVKVVTYSGTYSNFIIGALYYDGGDNDCYIGVGDNGSGWQLLYNGGSVAIPATPFWVRIKKIGTTGYRYYSTNGISWTQAGSSVTVGSTGNIAFDCYSQTAGEHMGVHFDDFVSNDVTTSGTTDINIYPLSSGIDNFMNVCISGATTYFIPVVSGEGAGTYPTDLRIRKDGYTCTVQSERA